MNDDEENNFTCSKQTSDVTGVNGYSRAQLMRAPDASLWLLCPLRDVSSCPRDTDEGLSKQVGRTDGRAEKFHQVVPGVLGRPARGSLLRRGPPSACPAEGPSSRGDLRLRARSSSADSSLRPAAPSRQTSVLGLGDADYPALSDLKWSGRHARARTLPGTAHERACATGGRQCFRLCAFYELTFSTKSNKK